MRRQVASHSRRSRWARERLAAWALAVLTAAWAPAAALGAARVRQAAAAPPALAPYPRKLRPAAGKLRIGTGAVIAVASDAAADRFAAGRLASELAAIEHVTVTVRGGNDGAVVIERADSAAGRAALAAAGVSLPADAGPDGYALLVDAHHATVIGDGASGVFYGVATLRQLLHPDGAGGAVAPAVTIADWPALAWRAVQIDVSRGPIPTLDDMERAVALLAEFKVNLLVLYFENTFAYSGQPLMHAPGGAITPAEARALVAFARPYHVDIVPEQESFGHLHLALQEEQYQDLAEVPYGSVLSPAAPGSLDLISGMFAELAQVFPGPFFHIGADETSELGEGRSQPLAEAAAGPPARQVGQVYIDYLRQIMARLAPYHRRILFWGDIAVRQPELLTQLPAGVIAVPWDYSPAPSYAREIAPFHDAGIETWVAPGVSDWNRIFPDYGEAIANIAGFVADGRRLGSTGMIDTTWMDDGEALFDSTWYGLGFGACAAWEDAPDPARYDAAYDWAVFRADGHHFAGEIADLDAIPDLLKPVLGAGAVNASDRLAWLDPFSLTGQSTYTRMQPAAHALRLKAEAAIADLEQHRAGARRNADLLQPVAVAARRWDFVGEKAIYAQMIASQYNDVQKPGTPRGRVLELLGRINGVNGWLQDMRDQAAGLRDQYQALWLAGNTPYFLGDILVRYDQELRFWQDEARAFDAIAAAYRSTGTLPPLVHPDIMGAPEGVYIPAPVVPRIIH